MTTKKEKQLFIEQLKKTPIIQVACDKTGFARSTYYRIKESDPVFRKAAEDAIFEGSNLVNDLAISQLINAIKDRNLTAITYWLKHNHPNYGDKLQLSGKVEVENAPLTEKQQELITKALTLAGIASKSESYDTPSDNAV